MFICFGCRSGQKVTKSLPGQAHAENKRQVSCCLFFFFFLTEAFLSLLLFLSSSFCSLPPLPLPFLLSLPSWIYTNYPSCPSQYTIVMMILEMMVMIIEENSQYIFKRSLILILWLGKMIFLKEKRKTHPAAGTMHIPTASRLLEAIWLTFALETVQKSIIYPLRQRKTCMSSKPAAGIRDFWEPNGLYKLVWAASSLHLREL